MFLKRRIWENIFRAFQDGKIYNVSDKNKFREMKDEASQRKYGNLKLKCADGKFKDEIVGRVIANYINNPNEKRIVGRKDVGKTNSGALTT